MKTNNNTPAASSRASIEVENTYLREQIDILKATIKAQDAIIDTQDTLLELYGCPMHRHTLKVVKQ